MSAIFLFHNEEGYGNDSHDGHDGHNGHDGHDGHDGRNGYDKGSILLIEIPSGGGSLPRVCCVQPDSANIQFIGLANFLPAIYSGLQQKRRSTQLNAQDELIDRLIY